MKHQLLIFASIGLVVFFALLNIDFPALHSPTGNVVDEPEIYAMTLDDIASRFFNIAYIDFPAGGCGEVASDLYNLVFLQPLDATAGFSTSGNDRLATINFVIGRTEHVGTLDMMNKAPGTGDNAVLNLNAEAVVNIPKQSRSTFLVMDLHGITGEGKFYVTKGRFSTPSIDCSFITRTDQTVCDCKVHSITGIAVAGITSPTPPPEIYEFLQKQTKVGTTVR